MFYAVANGRTIGVFTNWTDCKHSVQGFSGAVFKKFDTNIDAEAFIASKSLNISQTPATMLRSTSEFTRETSARAYVSRQSGVPVSADVSIHCEPPTDYYVYTDGACSKNGMRGASAGIGVYFGEGDVRNISKRLPGKQTNNVAELTAIISAFPFIESDIRGGKRIAIVTDSEYSIKCASSYGERCAKNGWVDDIPNKELVRQIYTLYSREPNIRFIHVKAHTGLSDIHSIGNHHADRLATDALNVA
jgi:ribonuclease HI